jgi:hypothetical protein
MRNRLRGKILLIAGAVAAALTLLVGSVAVAPSPASATVPAQEWSTADRFVGPAYAPEGQVVSNVRGTGLHSQPNFDRVVIDTISATQSRQVGFSVRYVSQVTADGSGAVLSLSGSYKLEVVVNAPAYNQAGQSTYNATVGRDLPGVSDGRRVVDTVYGGSFEGVTTFGIGLNAQKPFRVVPLADGRVAVDIQH